MKHKIKLVDGENAMAKYHCSSRETRRLKKAAKKYEKDPLANPDYIKRAKANPQSAYQVHMFVTRKNASHMTKEEREK